MARSSPFTRLFTDLMEDLAWIAENGGGVGEIMPDFRRLASMILADPRFHEELPKDYRERLQTFVVS